MAEGVHATGVRGVLDSDLLEPTSIITGVSPSTHGIPTNRPFDPQGRQPGMWFWYANEIRVPTLWQAAADGRKPRSETMFSSCSPRS
jgi:hypothetical protein